MHTMPPHLQNHRLFSGAETSREGGETLAGNPGHGSKPLLCKVKLYQVYAVRVRQATSRVLREPCSAVPSLLSADRREWTSLALACLL